MENTSSLSLHFLSQPFLIAATFTALCFAFALLTLRSFPFPKKTVKSNGAGKTCRCFCSCNGTVSLGHSDSSGESHVNGDVGAVEMPAVANPDQRTGASMMEQLVPEITTHALSYLDYPSLCRLSMTNSAMRKAANDDNAWKALYHKDFTLEQDSVTPVNGWKAYYAATRAIVNVNAEFFNIIRERSLPAMTRLWLNADYVKRIHASGGLFSGYNSVIQSWQVTFSWEQGIDFQVHDVRVRVLPDMAWVTMKTYVDMDTRPFNVTNVFEFHNGRWYMVHHHISVMLAAGEVGHHIVHP